jgi:hypothetical protein
MPVGLQLTGVSPPGLGKKVAEAVAVARNSKEPSLNETPPEGSALSLRTVGFNPFEYVRHAP